MKKRARVAENVVCKSMDLHAQLQAARKHWGKLSQSAIRALEELLANLPLSVTSGDILFLEGRWYVTHAGLLRVAAHNRCSGIGVQPITEFCDRLTNRWAFMAWGAGPQPWSSGISPTSIQRIRSAIGQLKDAHKREAPNISSASSPRFDLNLIGSASLDLIPPWSAFRPPRTLSFPHPCPACQYGFARDFAPPLGC
jgi:hypothetical protein